MSNSIQSRLMMNDVLSDVDLQSSSTSEDCLHLLVSVREKTDITYWVRYVSKLKDRNTAIKINLLHVIETVFQRNDSHAFLRETTDTDEGLATTIINEASQHLKDNGIPFQAYIRQGDAGSEILDAAEALGCHAIILPEMKPKSWGNILSGGVIRRVLSSSRSVPVVIVDTDGIAKVWRE